MISIMSQPIPFIDEEAIEEQIAIEGLLDQQDMMANQNTLKERALRARGIKATSSIGVDESWEQMMQPKSFIVEGEKHLHIDWDLLWCGDYIHNLFQYFSKLKSEEIVKIFNSGFFGDDGTFGITTISPLLNALSLTNAKTIFMCYNECNALMTTVALGCKEIVQSTYGVLTFKYPDYKEYSYGYIHDEILNSLYTSYVDRGILTEEQLAALKDNPSMTIRKYGDKQT